MLKTQSDVDDEVNIVMDGKKGVILDIKLKIRKAILEPEFTIEQKEVTRITKMYPEFKLSSKTQEGVVPDIKVGENVAATPAVTQAPKVEIYYNSSNENSTAFYSYYSTLLTSYESAIANAFDINPYICLKKDLFLNYYEYYIHHLQNLPQK